MTNTREEDLLARQRAAEKMGFPKKIDTVKSKLPILQFDRTESAFGNPV